MAADPVVLLVEDTQSLTRLYSQYLADQPIDLVSVATGKAALAAIDRRLPAVVLLDLNLPDMNGMEVLRHVQAGKLPILVVVITAHGSVNVAVEAMQAGAYDFIVKPFSAERFLVTLRNALDRQRLLRLVDNLKDSAREGHHGFIGGSLPMQAVYRIIDAAAASRATVFITGESGTGKEVCAEAIHRQSPRHDGPFVAINCGAIPRDLMESEIFGHVKGAFTGAVADRDGAATRADGGTLFLDEVCEMDPALQTKMLRILQTGCFEKVGGGVTHRVDIRIVCATNRNPLDEVRSGR
ncbi:MAG: sigma-54-dependent transcriptional regulator, partial [Alphaproteobacteria bacterium]